MNGQDGGKPDVKPYGKCQDCGIDLADRDALNAHTKSTMAPTGEAGVTARSHRVQVVNPTEEERQASRVRSAIKCALDDLYAELDEHVGRGDCSEELVTEQMRWFDLRDGWDDYVAEGVVRYTAPCATCRCLAFYVARPDAALRVTCPTCEAKP